MKKRLLIVDDEMHARKHMTMLLEDSPNEIYEAANGVEALEVLKQERIDVLVTDVRMPKMDGIELIRQTRIDHPLLPSIVLSNFAEFGLAQQAIRYGAREYLLEATLTKEELLEGIGKVLRMNERGPQRALDRNERITITNALFHERLSNRISTAELIRRARKHEIALFSNELGPIRYAFVQVNRFSSWLESKYSGQMDLAVFAIDNLLVESMGGAIPGREVFHLNDGRFIVVETGDSMPDIGERFRRSMKEIERCMKVTFSVIYGYHATSIDEMFACVQRHMSDFDQLFYSPYGTLVHKEELHHHFDTGEIDFYHYFTELLRNNDDLIRNRQLPIWIESFLGLLEKVKRKPNYIKEDLQLLMSFIEKSGYSIDHRFQKELQQLKADHMNDYRDLIQNWLHDNRFFSNYSKELTRVIEYIHAHYSDKITLDDVCAVANLSRSHFSKIFKEEVGMTLMEYVEMIRMNQARMLLKTTYLTIGQISEMIGIPDIFYFSKLYKRRFRVSPSKDRGSYPMQAEG